MAKKKGRLSKIKNYAKLTGVGLEPAFQNLNQEFYEGIGRMVKVLHDAGVPLFEEGGQIKSKPKRKKPTKPLGRAPRLTLEGQYKAKPLGRAPNLKGKINKDAIKLLKKGGQAKSKSPRGCGKALRGYGKAMKKGK